LPAPTKILFVTSEIYPLVKTGGLADISGALPLALRKIGLDVRVLIPGYPPILDQLPGVKPLASIPAPVGIAGIARILGATMPGSDLPLLVLDCPALFARPGGPYLALDGRDWPDNVLRFGLLSQAGALLSTAASPLDWKPEVVHCNDWQSGLIPALLHFAEQPHASSVMSIHNLMFQGNFGQEWVTRLGLPSACYTMEGVEFFGHFSFLKAGLHYADQITTVSQTYAHEIQTAEFGYGMDGLLRARSTDLHGIVNGIGSDWNPATDAYLGQPYDHSRLQAKAAIKRELQRELGLKAAPDTPLFCMVSRLTHQKGIDLILDSAHELLHGGAQLAVLGSGEALYEHRLRDLAKGHPGQISATLGYDEALAHRLIAGGDIFLMPSRFEPCGLSQMYAMAYGTPPVVRRTGGLADTVVACDKASLRNGSATGLVFDEPSPAGFVQAAHQALALYQDNDIWRSIQQNGMRRDFGWGQAANSYSDVYRTAIRLKGRKPPEPRPAPTRPAKQEQVGRNVHEQALTTK
jgi:starch synthase